MKGLITSSLIALFYLLVIIFFHHALAEPIGVADKKDDSNPLADLFQIGDPNMRATLGAIYGAYKGNDQCSRKAFCMLGNYMRDMPGRDLAFLFMGNYIPAEYSLYYEIFKVAVQYGQNCDVYVCVPDSESATDAATAARPFSFFGTTSTTTTTTSTTPAPPTQQQQQQRVQQQNRPNQKPQSLDAAFGNSIPR